MSADASNDNNTAPIGVFDSGLGGLTVAARIMRRLPNESIVYLADTAHVPYGERPLDEILGFAMDITGFLRRMGAKMVVMACNMSSAVALGSAREAFAGMPALGVINPGSRAAVRASSGGPIGVLATTGTVSSHAYARIIRSIAPETQVYEQACPAFVPLVESGEAGNPKAYAAAREYVDPLLRRGVGTIILGCTHYPFLSSAISAAAGPSVRLIDPAEETVSETEKIILEHGIQAAPSQRAQHKYFCTGDTAGFAELGGRFIGSTICGVERAVWGADLGKVLA